MLLLLRNGFWNFNFDAFGFFGGGGWLLCWLRFA